MGVTGVNIKDNNNVVEVEDIFVDDLVKKTHKSELK